ncbi:hypothetical protein ACF0H5_021083 [Mactra antiquata]
MASINVFPHWMIIALILLCQVLFHSALDTDQSASCPDGCDCSQYRKVVCTGLSEFPSITNKSFIHALDIYSHSITELSPQNFSGFTHLERLNISKGLLKTIAEGTFDGIKDTIVRIQLNNNKLTEISSGVFKDLKLVDEILLSVNHLNKLDEDSFVNLPELMTLKLNGNHLDSIVAGAFKDLPKLENLYLNVNYLTEIPASSINQLKALKDLNLAFNQIDAIADTYDLLLPNLEDILLDSNPISKMTIFPKISNSLKTLNLQFTHLSSISKDAWKNVANIDSLFLSGTMLKSVYEGMFDGLVNLTRLYLRDMPVLTVIGPNSFRGLTKLHSIDVASSPMLGDISEDAFKSTSVTSFFAYDCKLIHIAEKLLPWADMDTVMIKDNPIRCDCSVKWMVNSTFGNNTVVKGSFDQLICETPLILKGSMVTKIHEKRLVCVESDHVKRLYTGVIVVVICAVFIISFALIMKFRKRIMISCRKYYQYRRYQNDAVFTVEHDTSVAELEDTDYTDGRPLKNMRLEI